MILGLLRYLLFDFSFCAIDAFIFEKHDDFTTEHAKNDPKRNKHAGYDLRQHRCRCRVDISRCRRCKEHADKKHEVRHCRYFAKTTH